MTLDTIEDYVTLALKQNPKTRTNDFMLYGATLKRMGIDISLPLAYLFANAERLNIPPMESVTRARRKVQEKDPSLKDKTTEYYRQEKINEYINYAIN